ncbi:MAG: VanZ family protein [Desulfuromusa sp.]|nr:VanZ family protein [Desulfuromusa sp.]
MGPLLGKNSYILWVLALVAATLLFVGGPDTYTLRSFRYIWGVGHLFCFALWAYLYVSWRSNQSFLRQILEVLLLAFVLGGLTELIQSQIGREAAWQDLGNDLIGGLLGVVFFAESRRTLVAWKLRLLRVPVLLIFLWSLLPVVKVIIDDTIAFRQFPLLSGFETPLETSRWSCSAKRIRDDTVSFSGGSSLRLDLTTQRYSGIGLKDFPRDWSAYRSVSLQVFNPDQEPLLLHFRIHDQYHSKHKNARNNVYSDRFNSSFKIVPGWNALQVSLAKVASAPKDRMLDLSRIAGMGVFVGKLTAPRTIYLDDVMLIP